MSILYWVFVGLVALVLVFVLLVLVLGARPRAVAQAEPHIGPAGPASAVEPIVDAMPEPAAPEPPRAKAITLRCGDCGTVFDVTDTGERPLYHTCPGCGAEGVLKGPAAPEPPTPAPEPTFVAPEPAPAPPPAPVHEAPVPSPPAAPRKLKLRCGGCKEVFVIDDSGERPLRRSCPHCGRLGEIR